MRTVEVDESCLLQDRLESCEALRPTTAHELPLPSRRSGMLPWRQLSEREEKFSLEMLEAR